MKLFKINNVTRVPSDNILERIKRNCLDEKCKRSLKKIDENLKKLKENNKDELS